MKSNELHHLSQSIKILHLLLSKTFFFSYTTKITYSVDVGVEIYIYEKLN